MESALVNAVNLVGVDINLAMRDPYYAVLLPYVAGLGPRKASGMIRRIGAAVSVPNQICNAAFLTELMLYSAMVLWFAEPIWSRRTSARLAYS